MRRDLYSREERTMILEEVLNVEVKDDKDVKSITSSSLNDTKREIIKRLRERGSRRSVGALVIQIGQCACDIYRKDDDWSKGNYTELIEEMTK